MKPLTAKQVECLEAISRGGTAYSAFASTTIHVLRERGLITGRTHYAITAAGLLALTNGEK